MYEQSFKFSNRPFNNLPCVEHFVAAESHQQALDVASMCVDRSTGPVVLVGAVGSGKSLMLQMLKQSFEDRFDIVNIECSRMESRNELLQSILFELDLPYTGLSEGELRMTLMGYLKKKEPSNEGVLLLVDEADKLSVDLIDELRMVTNQIRNGRSIVQLVLAGTRRLEESLNDPKLASFNQRIAARCVLRELSKNETSKYINQHIERAGRNSAEVFHEYAIDEIWTITDGCPRLVNQVCDQALILASARGKEPIDRELIREAWAEMQNIPMTRCEPSVQESSDADCDGTTSAAATSSVIEFGQLDDVGADFNTGGCAETEVSASGSSETIDDISKGMETKHWSTGQASSNLFSDPFAPPEACDEDARQISANAESEEVTVEGDAESVAAQEVSPEDQNPYGVLADGNTRFERISSLEQEQEELFQQAQRGTADSDSKLDEGVRSAFENLGLDAEDSVDEMIPADPFRLSEESEQVHFAQRQSQLRPTEDTVHTDDDEGVDESVGETQSDLGEGDALVEGDAFADGNASRRIEEQLGLIEPEPLTEMHQPPSLPQPVLESQATEDRLQPYSDHARQELKVEPEPEPTASPVPMAQDPFAESFEEEEMLQDAYTPFVAQQNQSSLDVTSEQLSHLTPIADLNVADSDLADSARLHRSEPEQSGEEAIEELDEIGVTDGPATDFAGHDQNNREADLTDNQHSDVASFRTGDMISDNAVSPTWDVNPTHAMASPDIPWQEDPATAVPTNGFPLPDVVQEATPETFKPVPSVAIEIGQADDLNEQPPAASFDGNPSAELSQVHSTSDQPADLPHAADQELVELTNVDDDLELLTSSLDAAETFDLGVPSETNVSHDASAFANPAGNAHPADGANPADVGNADMPGETVRHSNLMDLNDLVPGHLLAAKEEAHHQAQPAHDVSRDYIEIEPPAPSAPEQVPADDWGTDSSGVAMPTSFYQSNPEADSTAKSQLRAAEFLRTFHAQTEASVSHETESETVSPTESQYMGGGTQPAPVDSMSPEHPSQPPEVPVAGDEYSAAAGGETDPSQQVLKEIFDQQQIINSVHYAQPAEATDEVMPFATHGDDVGQGPDSLDVESLAVEYPVTEHRDYQKTGDEPVAQDDRDMLYVNESQQYQPRSETPQTPEQPVFPEVETSTGNAKRLDYSQLFDQLRNMPRE